MIEVDLFQLWAGALIAATGGLVLGRLTVWLSRRKHKPEDQPVEVVTSGEGQAMLWNGAYWYSETAVYYKSKKQNAQLHERVAELVFQMGDNARKNSVDLAIESGARGSAVVETAEQIYEYLLKGNDR